MINKGHGASRMPAIYMDGKKLDSAVPVDPDRNCPFLCVLEDQSGVTL